MALPTTTLYSSCMLRCSIKTVFLPKPMVTERQTGPTEQRIGRIKNGGA